MSWLNVFSPERRFERQYGEFLVSRFQTAPLPGSTRIDLEREFVPIRGLHNALASNVEQPVLIVGDPGSGKSTALAHLALAHAQALVARAPDARVPIFLSARELVPRELPRVFDLCRVLLGDVLAAQCPAGYFGKVVADGRAIVLVDDLDALPGNATANLQREFANTRIVATAAAPLPGAVAFPLPSMCDHEIQAFARGWDPRNAAAFLSALKSAGVPRASTGNRMTLALLTRIWQSNQPLPTRRTALFDAYADSVLKDATETSQNLEGVALAALQGRPTGNGVSGRSRGFLRAGKNHTAEFVHELWNAYFAARALRREDKPYKLRDCLPDPHWHEAIVFYGGWGDASDLVNSLVGRDDLYLAGRVLANAHQARPELRETVTRELIHRAWNGDARATAVLSEMESETAVVEFGARLKDQDPQNRARAADIMGQLSLDRAVDYLLPHLREPDPAVRNHVVKALGLARTDRVIEPLLVALRGDTRIGQVDVSLRVAAAEALGMLGSDRAVPALTVDMQHGEPELSAAAAQALKLIPSKLRIGD